MQMLQYGDISGDSSLRETVGQFWENFETTADALLISAEC